MPKDDSAISEPHFERKAVPAEKKRLLALLDAVIPLDPDDAQEMVNSCPLIAPGSKSAPFLFQPPTLEDAEDQQLRTYFKRSNANTFSLLGRPESEVANGKFVFAAEDFPKGSVQPLIQNHGWSFWKGFGPDLLEALFVAHQTARFMGLRLDTEGLPFRFAALLAPSFTVTDLRHRKIPQQLEDPNRILAETSTTGLLFGRAEVKGFGRFYAAAGGSRRFASPAIYSPSFWAELFDRILLKKHNPSDRPMRDLAHFLGMNDSTEPMVLWKGDEKKGVKGMEVQLKEMREERVSEIAAGDPLDLREEEDLAKVIAFYRERAEERTSRIEQLKADFARVLLPSAHVERTKLLKEQERILKPHEKERGELRKLIASLEEELANRQQDTDENRDCLIRSIDRDLKANDPKRREKRAASEHRNVRFSQNPTLQLECAIQEHHRRNINSPLTVKDHLLIWQQLRAIWTRFGSLAPAPALKGEGTSAGVLDLNHACKPDDFVKSQRERASALASRFRGKKPGRPTNTVRKR